MDNHLIYYSEQVPITGGAYLPVDNTYLYLYKFIKGLGVCLNVLLIIAIAYAAYLLLSCIYSKYLDIVNTINDTNEKVSNINSYIENMVNLKEKEKEEIEKLQIEPPTIEEEKEKVFIVDEDGVIVDSKKTEE